MKLTKLFKKGGVREYNEGDELVQSTLHAPVELSQYLCMLIKK
jgi:hypothetical protein